MDLPYALVDGLTLLSDALDDPLTDLEAVLRVLTDDLTAAVPMYLGLTITLHHDDSPVIISTLEPRDIPIRASLLLSLLPAPGSTRTGSVVFYSGAAGSPTWPMTPAGSSTWMVTPCWTVIWLRSGQEPTRPACTGCPHSMTSTKRSGFSSRRVGPWKVRAPNSTDALAHQPECARGRQAPAEHTSSSGPTEPHRSARCGTDRLARNAQLSGVAQAW